MKINHIILKGILFVFLINLVISCDRKEIDTDSLQVTNDTFRKELATTFSMDARFASLYALQYAKVIDPNNENVINIK